RRDDRDGVAQDIDEREGLGGVDGLGSKMYGDDDIRTQASGDVDRQIIQDAAIDEDGLVLAVVDRAEESRQRHGGAQREAERLVAKYMLIVKRSVSPVGHRGHVCGYATERNGQLVEVLELPVWQSQPVQDQADAVAGIKALG